ncbi:MAG TPA: efflux RND transporter periplasmic adaptor subunit [Phycisphaerales bacterium]|nr:efflux RND transporter periplasmic adaptor subunit [Phycisphaerales bacterium]
MKRAILWVIVLAAIGAAGYFGWTWYAAKESTPVAYRTGSMRKTDISQTISATGTVVPEDVIDVGAQVNGQIDSFGTDKAGKTLDYRSEVVEGQTLAKIDDALYQADFSSAKAQKASAEAQVAQAVSQILAAQAQVKVGEANREQAKAKLEQARRDWERAQRLGNTAALSRVDYDAAQSAFEQAIAAVSVAEATISQARAMVTQAEAAKAQAEAGVLQADAAVQRTTRNVKYCVITSPVSGVLIDKRVEIGQTVVASLNAPSLFLIAKDLSKMEVLVQVNEADIGSVHPGQSVTFGVDAFGGRRFRGEVRKIRLNATMTQNVVTYTVEIATDNADLTLLPYLTANVRFEVAHRDSVLAVPNAALRWSPTGSDVESTTSGKKDERSGTVWVLKDGQPQPVHVQPGLSDGVMTEVSGGGLTEGQEVIVGEQTAEQTAAAGGTNPFAPQMFRGRRSSGTSTSTGSGGTRPGGAGGSGGSGGGGGGGGGSR